MYHQASMLSHSASSPAIILFLLVAPAARALFYLSLRLAIFRFRRLPPLLLYLFSFGRVSLYLLLEPLASLPPLASGLLPHSRLQSCGHLTLVAQFPAALQELVSQEEPSFLVPLQQAALIPSVVLHLHSRWRMFHHAKPPRVCG